MARRKYKKSARRSNDSRYFFESADVQLFPVLWSGQSSNENKKIPLYTLIFVPPAQCTSVSGRQLKRIISKYAHARARALGAVVNMRSTNIRNERSHQRWLKPAHMNQEDMGSESSGFVEIKHISDMPC